MHRGLQVASVVCFVLEMSWLSQSVAAQCQYEVTIVQAPQCPPPFANPNIKGMDLNSLGDVVGRYDQCDTTYREGFFWTAKSGQFITLERRPELVGIEAQDVNDGQTIVGEVDTPGFGSLAFVWQDGEFTFIYPPNDGSFSSAYEINNDGTVIGAASDGTDGYTKGFLWNDGDLTVIEPRIGPRSVAAGINEAGHVVGWMGNSSGTDSHAFIWRDGAMTDLGIPAGAFASQASAINHAGYVVGASKFDYEGPPHWLGRAYLWDSEGNAFDLGNLLGLERCTAVDINDRGRVVGSCRLPDLGNNDAFVWQNGEMRNLNDLIPSESGVHLASARGINNAGQIVCWGGVNGESAMLLLTPIGNSIADLTGDCQVGADDLAILLGDWGLTNSLADLDGDGAVGPEDLAIMLGHWG